MTTNKVLVFRANRGTFTANDPPNADGLIQCPSCSLDTDDNGGPVRSHAVPVGTAENPTYCHGWRIFYAPSVSGVVHE